VAAPESEPAWTAQVSAENRVRIAEALAALGMAPGHPRLARLRAHDEETRLAPVPGAEPGRVEQLAPPAAESWAELRAAAAARGVALLLVSGYRSYAYQRGLVERKLAAGASLEAVLRTVAPPGFSEHHTGCAADFGVPGCAELTAAFERTEAFAWLASEAGRHGWSLSYPEGNPEGFIFEPWHWRWRWSPL
jgi:zinc D-Ala-D-Ala carboxypeptidase